MDLTSTQNTSNTQVRDFQTPAAGTSPSVRTVEPNRSQFESTEQRLYGAYRNMEGAITTLTPDSTPDAPLIYPFDDTVNADAAAELNSGAASVTPAPVPRPVTTVSPVSTARPTATMPMPNFISSSQPLSQPMPQTNRGSVNTNIQPVLYTPVNGNTSIGAQRPVSYTPTGYANLTTMPQEAPNYQMNPDYNMYLPTRNTPYYNMGTEGRETLSDYEEAERDMEYLQQLYPAVWRRLQAEVQEECDRLEYEGSCMFDQYPDRVTIDRIIRKIYDRVKDYDEFKNYEASKQNDVTASQIFYHPCPRCNWIEDFTRIMFLNEMGNRRRRYRSRRHWFY